MPVYEYTARSVSGEETTGTVDLPSIDAVREHLRKNRLMVVRVREQRKRKRRAARVPTRDIVVFTRQFATMISAGLPLVQSLDILAQQTENKTLSEVTRQCCTTSRAATRSPTHWTSTAMRSRRCS